ncbi:tRNA pseudouridine(55) synthase TruB [Chrysiogenes arsenatis]|uniref:tRNA pseudouridine(55) synthase TruB n=1 Tax=Chrysiogenes arsenatis TaxID=309797 RepID=UPI000429CFC3|nr:tRNA pseudouridine(55) synthase TruB [Chrysiogenes arsenatis]
MSDAIFAIDKPVGVTSHDVVAKMRRLLGQRKVGHAGTLDPFAEGVLIVLAGDMTKLAPYLDHQRKRYRATLALGTQMDTGDCEGDTIATAPVLPFDAAQLRQIEGVFTGTITLRVPRYSAVKIGGKKGYELARQGVTCEMPLRENTIHAISLEILNEHTLCLDVTVSGGTYVRALGEAVAAALGTVGHLTTLARLECCGVCREECHTLETLTRDGASTISLSRLLGGYPAFQATPSQAEWLRNGQIPRDEPLAVAPDQDGFVVVYNETGALISIIDWGAQKIARNFSGVVR